MGVNALDLNLYYYFKENGWYTIKNYKQHEVERKCDPWEIKRENHDWKPTQMEELLGRDFKINTINMLKHLVNSVHNTQQHMEDFSREKESIKRNKWKCWKYSHLWKYSCQKSFNSNLINSLELTDSRSNYQFTEDRIFSLLRGIICDYIEPLTTNILNRRGFFLKKKKKREGVLLSFLCAMWEYWILNAYHVHLTHLVELN